MGLSVVLEGARDPARFLPVLIVFEAPLRNTTQGSPTKSLTFSGLMGTPIGWQKVKVLTSEQNAPLQGFPARDTHPRCFCLAPRLPLQRQAGQQQLALRESHSVAFSAVF